MKALLIIILVYHYGVMCIHIEDTKCRVYEKLTLEDFPSPLVEFTAWISKEDSFQIVLEYNHKEYDSIKVNSSGIIFNRKQQNNQTEKIIVGNLSFGWQDFILTIDEMLSFSDEHKSFFRIPLNKKIDTLTIESGLIMLYCPSHIPIWKVRGSATNIKLMNEPTNVHQELSFYSQNSFTPRIQVQGQNIPLGTLKPHVQHIFTLSMDDTDGLALEVKNISRRFGQIILSENLNYFSVAGDYTDHFYVRQMVQKMPPSNQTTTESEDLLNKFEELNNISSVCSTQSLEINIDQNKDEYDTRSLWLYISLGVMSFLFVVTLSILLYKLHKVDQLQSQSRPVSDHTYEEIDEDAIVKSLQMKNRNVEPSSEKCLYLEPMKKSTIGSAHNLNIEAK